MPRRGWRSSSIFEITETSELTSLQRARAFISALKKLGCRFALDDFGTGFSSFTHLRHLPVDLVKIEGSFVEGMVGSELDRKMVGSITQLAQSFRLKVIGEHVDSFADPGRIAREWLGICAGALSR